MLSHDGYGYLHKLQCIDPNLSTIYDRLQALQVQYWHQEGRGSKIFIIHQNQRFLKQVFSKRLGL